MSRATLCTLFHRAADQVDAWLDGGALRLRWSYAASLHDATTIEELVGATLRSLAGLADDTDGAEALRAADFPHADLDALDLERVLSQLRPAP